jgi:hypothetical protein
MKTKLTRKQIAEGLKATPIETILLGANNAKDKRLTASQIKFAEEIAKGKTKAEAYRQSRPNGRKSNAKPSTASRKGQELSKVDAIQTQIEAFKVALEAQKYQTPLHLRALTIHKLTEKVLDPDCPPAQQIKAMELLGKITEVALFTERREVIRHDTSDQMKEKLLTSLRLAISAQGATDLKTYDPDSLLAELTAKPIDREIDSGFMSGNDDQTAQTLLNGDAEGLTRSNLAEPTAPPPPFFEISHGSLMHSIPHNQSPQNSQANTVSLTLSEESIGYKAPKGKPLHGEGGINISKDTENSSSETPPVTIWKEQG